MAGLPLFFTQGERIGLQVWVGLLNWLSMLLLFLWLRKKVLAKQEVLLAAFLAFSPWSLLFSPAWNPSFLPVLAVPFFWLLEIILRDEGQGKERSFWRVFFLGLLFILSFQLHLSAVLLGLAIVCTLGSIKKIPAFIGPQGLGFSGMVQTLNANVGLWPLAVIAYLGSCVMVALFLKYWWSLRLEKNAWARLEFYMPILMPLTFLFSIKGASAHTFWILMPLSFFSMVQALKGKEGFLPWLYVLGSLSFVVATKIIY